MDQFELAKELYDDYRSDHGDGEYAWDAAMDEAGERIRRENARQDAWEDYRADFGDGETVTIWDNKWANKPAEASGGSGDVAIGVALVTLGAALGYGLYKWLFNEDAEKAPATTPASEAHTPKMKELIRSTNGDYDSIRDSIRKDLNSRLEQPGSIFYMSTEFQVADLAGHFGRFKDPKHIDMFIRGETRTKVLEMAELWKVAIGSIKPSH